MTRPLLDPRLLDALGDFFPDRVTIQETVITLTTPRDGYNRPIGPYSDKPGHVGIPANLGSRAGQAVLSADGSITVASRTLLLQGYYPDITEDMRAVIGTETWAIVGVTHDALRATTSLSVRKAE